jgi:ribosomal protein S28E/S33
LDYNVFDWLDSERKKMIIKAVALENIHRKGTRIKVAINGYDNKGRQMTPFGIFIMKAPHGKIRVGDIIELRHLKKLKEKKYNDKT